MKLPKEARAVLDGTATWAMLGGRAERLLEALPPRSVDLVLTDCPYSSGGQFRGDRAKSTDTKYTNSRYAGRHADFEGDTRDQLSFYRWAARLWLPACLDALKPGGSFIGTIDWRQLSALESALQAAGFVIRGLATWDKGRAARPRPGGFRMQGEYILHATRGALVERDVYLDGVFLYPGRRRDKFHQTGKPTQLFHDLAALAPKGGLVIDPFAGSGTSGAGALLQGRDLRFLGVELVDGYRELATGRLRALDALLAQGAGGLGKGPFFWRDVERVQNAAFEAWKGAHPELVTEVDTGADVDTDAACANDGALFETARGKAAA